MSINESLKSIDKYIKYKNKYLELKDIELQKGGSILSRLRKVLGSTEPIHPDNTPLPPDITKLGIQFNTVKTFTIFMYDIDDNGTFTYNEINNIYLSISEFIELLKYENFDFTILNIVKKICYISYNRKKIYLYFIIYKDNKDDTIYLIGMNENIFINKINNLTYKDKNFFFMFITDLLETKKKVSKEEDKVDEEDLEKKKSLLGISIEITGYDYYVFNAERNHNVKTLFINFKKAAGFLFRYPKTYYPNSNNLKERIIEEPSMYKNKVLLESDLSPVGMLPPPPPFPPPSVI